MVSLPFLSKKETTPGAKPGKPSVRFPFVGAPLSPSWKVADKYPLNAPFAYAVIAEEPASGTRKYFVDEVVLSTKEASIYTYLLDTLESELSVPRSEIDPRAYFLEQAKRLVKKYSIKASQLSWPKINYFAERDLVGFGVIDGVMRDTQIEDITVDGVGKPLFIFHRRYDNIETNMTFLHDEELDNIIARLAHMAGKHVSTAFPIVQVDLAGQAPPRRDIQARDFTLRRNTHDQKIQRGSSHHHRHDELQRHRLQLSSLRLAPNGEPGDRNSVRLDGIREDDSPQRPADTDEDELEDRDDRGGPGDQHRTLQLVSPRLSRKLRDG